MYIWIDTLKEKYKDYTDIHGKIHRDVKEGKLIPLVKGLYETDRNIDGYKLAQLIYTPSYLSFDYALYRYDLIPEAVYKTYTCATYGKRKRKRYDNYFGTYLYRDIPKEVFYLGVRLYQEDNYVYHLADREKALCDKLYTMEPVRSLKALKEMLFEDLRIDEKEFEKLNKEDMINLAPLYHASNLTLLKKYLEGDNQDE